MTSQPVPRARPGFSVIEVVVALAALAVVMLVVAQVATWSMLERARRAEREAALEAAANVLEAARAEPAEALTAEWAAARRLPADAGALPAASRLRVRAEPEPAVPGARRVTVEVAWHLLPDEAAQSVRLVGVFAPRAAAGGGR